jgi:hypothetical protein
VSLCVFVRRASLGGIADQVRAPLVLGVVYQEDGSWQAHAQKALKTNSLWVLEATAVVSSLPTKVRLLMVQTFIYSAVMYGAEVWDTAKAKTDVSGRESSRSILALHPRDCSSDVLYGTLGYFHRCTH